MSGHSTPPNIARRADRRHMTDESPAIPASIDPGQDLDNPRPLEQ